MARPQPVLGQRHDAYPGVPSRVGKSTGPCRRLAGAGDARRGGRTRTAPAQARRLSPWLGWRARAVLHLEQAELLSTCEEHCWSRPRLRDRHRARATAPRPPIPPTPARPQPAESTRAAVRTDAFDDESSDVRHGPARMTPSLGRAFRRSALRRRTSCNQSSMDGRDAIRCSSLFGYRFAASHRAPRASYGPQARANAARLDTADGDLHLGITADSPPACSYRWWNAACRYALAARASLVRWTLGGRDFTPADRRLPVSSIAGWCDALRHGFDPVAPSITQPCRRDAHAAAPGRLPSGSLMAANNRRADSLPSIAGGRSPTSNPAFTLALRRATLAESH